MFERAVSILEIALSAAVMNAFAVLLSVIVPVSPESRLVAFALISAPVVIAMLSVAPVPAPTWMFREAVWLPSSSFLPLKLAAPAIRSISPRR
jgi:hypothetical protein